MGKIVACAASVLLIAVSIVAVQSLLPATTPFGARIAWLASAIVWPPLLSFWIWRAVSRRAVSAGPRMSRVTRDHMLTDNYGILPGVLTRDELTEVVALDAQTPALRAVALTDEDAAARLRTIETRLYEIGRATAERVRRD